MSSASAVPFHVLIEISKREESGLAYSISFRNFTVRMLGNAVNKIVAAFNSLALWGCRCRYRPVSAACCVAEATWSKLQPPPSDLYMEMRATTPFRSL